LSDEAHDFLSHCFQRDPAKRWTSAQLLQHPFLTTRFVAAPASLKAPASPISVMHFPDSDSDLSASFVNSVPTLAAPSLFKRGLVSAQAKVEQQVEENWWSSPASPDSGPWIVVRSPKSSSATSSFVVPEADSSSSIVGEEGEVCDAADNCTVDESSTAPCFETCSSEMEVVVGCSSDAEDFFDIQISSDGHVRHFAISEMDFSVALTLAARAACNYVRLSVLEKPLFSVKQDGSFLKTSLNLGTTSEYLVHEFFYHYSNPQILLYWWWPQRMIRKRLPKSSSRDFKHLKSGHSDQCFSQLLDEYTIVPFKLQNTRLLFAFHLHFGCV
jgi:serine/threonine protein kinase